MRSDAALSWVGILRLALVQTALGAIFVLATSTLNRVMVVELALPAMLPGVLIALHYAMQLLRPRLGHGSDLGGRRTPWIFGGMVVLAAGGFAAACGTALMPSHLLLGIALAVPAFVAIGIGVGACGTALLVLLAKRTVPERRPAAATLAWVMMIAGFIVTAGVASRFLDPFSPARLVALSGAISLSGIVVTGLATLGIEGDGGASGAAHEPFGQALAQVWSEPVARRFAIFVFVSMLAYGGEDLLVEPFAGALFHMSPGETARLTGLMHGGTLFGMLGVPLAAAALGRSRAEGARRHGLRLFMIGGCLASAAALLWLAALGLGGRADGLRAAVVALGVANGAYAIAAIASMMQLVGAGGPMKEGVRMGLWGAAQACAFGAGGLVATVLSDTARRLIGQPADAYAAVFALEATVFVVAAGLALRLHGRGAGTVARGDRLGLPLQDAA